MCSTPEPITTSWTPAAIWAAAKLTACCAEPHWRSTVVAGVSIGQAGLQPGVAPDVEALLAVLLDAAGDDVLDRLGGDPGALDDLAVGASQQLVGVGVLVVALLRVPAPDRRAGGLHDDDLTAGVCAHSRPLRIDCDVRLLLYRAVDWLVSQSRREAPTDSFPRPMEERRQSGSGVVGGGAIACGLAAVAAAHGEVVMWVRGPDSRPRTVDAARAARRRARLAACGSRPTSTRWATRTFVVEAIVEDEATKAGTWLRTGTSARRRRDPRDHHVLAVDRRPGPTRPAARTASSAFTSSTR